MPDSDRPFFLVGAERSGTSLLRLMLEHHPQIACAAEFEFLVGFPGFAGAQTDPIAYARGMMHMNEEHTILVSATGSSVVLKDAATVGASLGAKLELGTDATLGGASVIASAGLGGKLTLDAGAAVEGALVSCTSSGGSMTLTSLGATLDGTMVGVSAQAVATIASAVVKIN